MAKGEVKAMMEELYPTAEDMLRDRAQYKSWAALARAIDVTASNLQDHRQRLGMERVKPQPNQMKNFSTVNEKQMSETIQELFSSNNTNVFRRYKIVEPDVFYANTLGYEGLEFIAEEQGKTWRAIHNPSIVTERMMA